MIGTRPEQTKTERNQTMLEMRRSGKKLREISEQFGLSVERTRQIILREKRLERQRKQYPDQNFY